MAINKTRLKIGDKIFDSLMSTWEVTEIKAINSEALYVRIKSTFSNDYADCIATNYDLGAYILHDNRGNTFYADRKACEDVYRFLVTRLKAEWETLHAIH